MLLPSIEIVRMAEYETAVEAMANHVEERAAFDELVDALLVADPEIGNRVPGAGGVRKMRVALPGRGKRGGARVLYYYVVTSQLVFLLLAYAKGDADDLSGAGKRYLRMRAREMDAFRPTQRRSEDR